MTVDFKLISESPSDQNVIDLFAGEWSTEMPKASGLKTTPGTSPLMEDPRIVWLNDVIGPLIDKNVLELGPLEGAHSYMLQNLGAQSVTAVEANTRAFLKCLAVKEIFKLDRVKFKLGNFFRYLENCDSFDVIVASGVLYHMVNPLDLLELITRKTSRVFIWTHYYDHEIMNNRPDRSIYKPLEQIGAGPYMGARRLYPEAALTWNGFNGGLESYAVWLSRDSLLRFFEDRGFSVTLSFEHKEHASGPSLALCAQRINPST